MSANRTKNKRIDLSFMEFIYFLRNVGEIIKKSFIRKEMMSEKSIFHAYEIKPFQRFFLEKRHTFINWSKF